MKNKKCKVSFLILVWLIIVGLAGCKEKEKNIFGYDEYLKKVWVVDNWHGDENRYHAMFYFTIDSVEDNCIQGRYSMYEYIHISDDDIWLFSGTVSEDSAKCELYIGSNKVGMMELFFDDGKIKAEINIEKLEGLPKSYVFRPYSLNDIAHLYVNDKLTRAEHIDTWGDVNLVAGVIEIDKPYPVVYLTNGHDDILYEFSAAYQNASEVYEMSVEDYNGDGLDDVKIVTYFPYEEDSVFIERIFYQTDRGIFLMQ